MPSLHRELVQALRDNVNHRTKDRLQVMVLGAEESQFVPLLPDAIVISSSELSTTEDFVSTFHSESKNHPNECHAVVCNDVLSTFGVQQTQVEKLLNGLLNILKPGGLLVFRHNLETDAASLGRYTHLLDTFRSEEVKDDKGWQAGFLLLSAKSLNSSIHEKQNWGDVCWVLRKDYFSALSSDQQHATVREFLDKSQYTDQGIKAYEYIFGEGFISPGGAASNSEFISRADLKLNMNVLDVGCGIGGNLFHVAQEYGSNVIGVDLSSNMLSQALERANSTKNTRIELIVADVMTYDFAENSLDVIYSRDCIIHIADKLTLFKRFHKWLKPGGVVVMTDYNVGDEKNFTTNFKAYLENRQYGLRTIQTYIDAFKGAGFTDVEGIDITEKFKQTLLDELDMADKNKAQFAKRFPEEQYVKLTKGWRQKLVFIEDGCQKWGKYYAKKL